MMYKCTTCLFESLYKSNYLRHIPTCNNSMQLLSSDDKKIAPLLSCKYCSLPYKTQGPLNNHYRKCQKRDIYEMNLVSSLQNKDNIIKEKDILIENIIKEKEFLKAEIVELKKQINDDKKDFKEMAKNANIQVTNNNMNVASESALRYITKNFPNAPVLERKDIPKLIEYDNSKEPEQDKLAEEWICAEKTGSLVPAIGKIIINIYKPDDPAFQPVWNSDVERLTFYRRALNDKKVGTWVTDKKGIDTSNEIIKPMLEHIEQQLVAYNEKHPTPEEIQRFGQIIMEHVETSHKIIARLKDGQLETSVLRFCAPHFSINKSKETPKKIKLAKPKVLLIKPKNK
jgi:hypothetical protein